MIICYFLQENIEVAKKEWELGHLQSLREEEERLAEEEKDDILLTYDRPEAANKVILRKGPTGIWEICHPPCNPSNPKPTCNASNLIASTDQHCNHLESDVSKQPVKDRYHTRHKHSKQDAVPYDSPVLDGISDVTLDSTTQQANKLDEQTQLNHQCHTPNTS